MKSTSSSFFPFFFPLLFILREKKCLIADKATVLAMRAIEQKKTDRERKETRKRKNIGSGERRKSYVSQSKRKLIITTFKRCDICRRVSLSRYGLAKPLKGERTMGEEKI